MEPSFPDDFLNSGSRSVPLSNEPVVESQFFRSVVEVTRRNIQRDRNLRLTHPRPVSTLLPVLAFMLAEVVNGRIEEIIRQPHQPYLNHFAVQHAPFVDQSPSSVAPVASRIPGNLDSLPPSVNIPTSNADVLEQIEFSYANIPEKYICPITQVCITKAAYDPSCPQCYYELPALRKWVSSNSTNPMTRSPLLLKNIVLAPEVTEEIKKFVNTAVLDYENSLLMPSDFLGSDRKLAIVPYVSPAAIRYGLFLIGIQAAAILLRNIQSDPETKWAIEKALPDHRKSLAIVPYRSESDRQLEIVPYVPKIDEDFLRALGFFLNLLNVVNRIFSIAKVISLCGQHAFFSNLDQSRYVAFDGGDPSFVP